MTSPQLPESRSMGRAVQHDYWSTVAGKWALLGPPLRPSDEDLRFFKAAMAQRQSASVSLRLLVLGVTPEFFHLSQVRGAQVSAVDHNQSMIDAIWPGPQGSAVFGEWTDLPVLNASQDLVFCDGGAIIPSYPDGLHRLAVEIHRVLKPGGLCVIRSFIQPQRHENAEDVLRDLMEGKVPNTNVLKLRLGMALQSQTINGVELAEIWRTLHQVAPDLDLLAERLGWVPAQLKAINGYRDSHTRYSFHTVAEFIQPFVECPGGFDLQSTQFPTYVLGERCPTMTFRRDTSSAPDHGHRPLMTLAPRPHFLR